MSARIICLIGLRCGKDSLMYFIHANAITIREIKCDTALNVKLNEKENGNQTLRLVPGIKSGV